MQEIDHTYKAQSVGGGRFAAASPDFGLSAGVQPQVLTPAHPACPTEPPLQPSSCMF